MKLAIIGSRSLKDEAWTWEMIEAFIRDHHYSVEIDKPTLISGGAEGIDTFSERYAKKWGMDHVKFLPYFKLDRVPYTPRHFFIRNKQIIDNADKVLALWDGKSKGTEHGIKYSQKTGKPVMVIKK